MTEANVVAMLGQKELCRLSVREEGDYWNAYIVDDEASLLLGTIRRDGWVTRVQLEAFTELMLDMIGDMIEAASGQQPDYLPIEDDSA